MAPTIAGTNCITKAEDALIAMIADCPAFQSFIGTVDAVAAKARIYIDDLPAPANDKVDEYTAAEWLALFPCCLIEPPEQSGESLILQHAASGGGGLYEYDPSLAFQIRFERFAPEGVSREDRLRKLKNDIGDIIEQMADRSGLDTFFAFSRLAPIRVPYIGGYDHTPYEGDIEGWAWGITREVIESA